MCYPHLGNSVLLCLSTSAYKSLIPVPQISSEQCAEGKNGVQQPPKIICDLLKHNINLFPSYQPTEFFQGIDPKQLVKNQTKPGWRQIWSPLDLDTPYSRWYEPLLRKVAHILSRRWMEHKHVAIHFKRILYLLALQGMDFYSFLPRFC